ncbi:hypothetical protein JTE90_025275 [Oedothorax gibbosus]|uniref:Uncharacterized protein n=1 Tax=Oedothorax gibbosus TaxID=931172 RepID=A0AAV6TCY7_9ARAC|nr:hypothetical protein JTE90_025275 [Oedothorax gibbosus]
MHHLPHESRKKLLICQSSPCPGLGRFAALIKLNRNPHYWCYRGAGYLALPSNWIIAKDLECTHSNYWSQKVPYRYFFVHYHPRFRELVFGAPAACPWMVVSVSRLPFAESTPDSPVTLYVTW